MSNYSHIEKPLTVIGICGSLRPGSYTQCAVRIALRAAEDAGAQTQLLDLANYLGGPVNGDLTESASAPHALLFRQEVRQAHAVILGTPEYHGSFSGILKSALDQLDGSEITGKVVGLIGVAGGNLGGLDALNGLRTICRSLQTWAIPQQVVIPEAWKIFDGNGVLQNPMLEKRLQELGRQVVRFATMHVASN